MKKAMSTAGTVTGTVKKAPKPIAARMSIDGTNIIGIVNNIILDAISRGSSVIRIHKYGNPESPVCRVIQIVEVYDKHKFETVEEYFKIGEMATIIARLKNMAEVHIHVHRRLQIGKIRFQLSPESDRCVQIKVAFFPSPDGKSEEVILSLIS